MKKGKCPLSALLFGLFVIFFLPASSQQPFSQRGSIPGAGGRPDSTGGAGYTYRVFEAPNKMYGYDILLNGKLVFHQHASSDMSGSSKQMQAVKNQPGFAMAPNSGMVKMEHAENAAKMSIEKLKKGQSPSLRQDEIQKSLIQKL
jgi:hypothetical protein